mmetsp:Transcript_57558/g.140574  ORF Transcript_57558/g.140574 Transcript_57558/m.140574 type:complete len:826 (-) Transcript_57558:106-2583(-)
MRPSSSIPNEEHRCRRRRYCDDSDQQQRLPRSQSMSLPRKTRLRRRQHLSNITFGIILLGSWSCSISQSFVHRYHHQNRHRRRPIVAVPDVQSSRRSRILSSIFGTPLQTTDNNDTFTGGERRQSTGQTQSPERYDETTDWNKVFSAIIEDQEEGEEVTIPILKKMVDEMNNSNDWKPAIRLLRWLEENNNTCSSNQDKSSTLISKIPRPDARLYHRVIKCCISSDESYHAMEILTSMLKKKQASMTTTAAAAKVQPLPESFDTTIALLSRQRKWRQSLELLDLMVEYDIPRTITTYNAVISVCARAQQVGVGKSLLSKMKNKDHIRPNAKTYATLIGACATPAKWKDALALLDQCYREPGVEPDIYIYTNAMRACAKGRVYQRALNILQVVKDKGLPLDAYAYTSCMEACGNSRKWYKALELFREMEDNDIQPTEVTYSVLINALGKGGKVDLALSMLDRMKKEGLEPNLYTYNAAITALSKASKKNGGTRGSGGSSRDAENGGDRSTTALGLLDQMKQSGIEPDGFCYSSAIACCGAEGRWVEACELIERMKEGGSSTRPNIVAYSAAISACGRAGESSKALALFDEMQSTGIGVDTVAYNAVFSALRATDDADKTFELWAKMCSSDNSNTAARYRGRGRKEVLGSRPDIITIQEVVSILSNAGRLDLMDEVFSEAARRGIVLSNDSLDDEYEVDLSGMSLPVARAACRYVMRRLLSPSSSDSIDSTTQSGREMTFITGVGIAHHSFNMSTRRPKKNPSTDSSSDNGDSESLFEKNPETSLQDYFCGILQTDFDPPLSHSIPERAAGTVAVEVPRVGQTVKIL